MSILQIGLGFPEFTQFFNHSHLWKLQQFTAGCSAIELLRNKQLKINRLLDEIFIANRPRERQASGNEMRRSAGKACLLRLIVLVLL